jgi:hypothetical protein
LQSVSRGFIDGEYQDGELRGVTLLLGRRGMGKTTEMARLLSLCTGGVIFFDTLSKHTDVLPDYAVISEPHSLVAYLKVNRGRRFNVLYQPRQGDLDRHFAQVCTIVRAFGWMILGVDEIDRLCGQRFGPSWMPPALYELVNYGRHCRVSMIATARRPQGVAAGFKSEAVLRVFRLKDGKAIDAIQEEIGEENVAKVRTLPKFFYLLCTDDDDPIVAGGPRVAL